MRAQHGLTSRRAVEELGRTSTSEDAGFWASRRWDGLVPGVLFAGLIGAILLLAGHSRWAWPVAALIVLVAVLASAPRRICLQGDALISKTRRKETRIPLADVTDVRLDWVWKVGEQLVIASATEEIRLEDLDRAKDFLPILGRALGDRANRSVVASSREARLLGLDLRWGTNPAD